MWIAHSAGNGGWVSIVAHRHKPDHLMVRARTRDHILSMWPSAEVYTLEGPHDYQYRADISREEVGEAIGKYAMEIEYDDYKSSVIDADLYRSLVSIWRVLVERFGRGPSE